MLPYNHRQKQNCIKATNSHKIIRYLHYKLQGAQRLIEIPYIYYENLINAIEVVSKEIINESLLRQVKKYLEKYTFVANSQQSLRRISRGVIFHGPPGTGKTILSQLLPNLIGYHLIQKGQSAADFSKSLVGQSSRMIVALFNRAKLSPYLICSIGIDEVDGLVPDRKDKKQKNSNEGTSMLLSLIDGNKDVPNLILFSSTNNLKKIDEAIRRRCNAQYHVGTLTSEARKIIILNECNYFSEGLNKQMFEYIVQITSNFTGAALKQVTGQFFYTYKGKKRDIINQKRQLGRQIAQRQIQKEVKFDKLEITEIASQVAQKFGYKIGSSTLPAILKAKQNKQYLFSESFMNKMHNRFAVISCVNQYSFVFYYANEVITELSNGRRQIQCESGKIFINSYDSENQHRRMVYPQPQNQIQTVFRWMNKINNNLSEQNQLQILILSEAWFRPNQHQFHKQEHLKCICQQLSLQRDSITILIVQGQQNQLAQIISRTNIYQRPKKNLYFFFFNKNPRNIEVLNWQKRVDKNYSGRLLIQLNTNNKQSDVKMLFQTINQNSLQKNLHTKKFIKVSKTSNPYDVVPDLVDFFNYRDVSFILYIDHAFLSLNGVCNKQKAFEIIQQKINEAKYYQCSAVIIDVDSLIPWSYSISDSMGGKSVSEGIADNEIYRHILSHLNTFAQVNIFNKVKRQQKWMGIIVKNAELAKILKKDMNWPLSINQKIKQEQEMKKNQKRICKHCHVQYTQRDNQKQRKCMQHPEYPIDIKSKKIQTSRSLHNLKIQQHNYSQSQRISSVTSTKKNFIYACCLKDLQSPGQKAYRHVPYSQQYRQDDEWLFDRENQKKKSWETVQKICQQKNHQ